jgi:hypothetical protein
MTERDFLPEGVERRIRSSTTTGGWTTPHVQHRRAAKVLLGDLRSQYASILKRRRREQLNGNEAAASLLGRTDDSGLRREALADAVVILSAMTVEAAVNLYGVSLLGERFHRRHLERLGIVQKIAMTIATVEHLALKPDAEILKITGRLFDLRNQLVHPKARELDISNGMPTERDAVGMATQAVKDMERILELLRTYSWQMITFTGP